MNSTLTAVFWIIGTGVVLAALAFPVLTWLPLRLARRIAEATENRLAMGIEQGPSGSGLGPSVIRNEAPREVPGADRPPRMASPIELCLCRCRLSAVWALMPSSDWFRSLATLSVCISRQRSCFVPHNWEPSARCSADSWPSNAPILRLALCPSSEISLTSYTR